MKIAPAMVTNPAPPAWPSWKTIRKTSAFLRKLSLKAAKNWHQNSGANRFVVKSLRNMASSGYLNAVQIALS